MTEYATRMADKTLNNKEKRNKKIKNEKEYNYNVNFLKFIEKNLAEVGYKDIVIEASYGTKTDLKKALKKITGDNTFYVTMVNAMYVITEKPNATEQEISTAKDQLAGLKETLKSKCKEYQKPSEKPKTSNKGGNGSKKSSGNGGGSNRSVPSSNNGDGSNGSGQETEQYNSPADLNRGYYSTLNAKNGAQKYNSPADLNREYYNGKKSSNGLGSKGSASSSNSGGGSNGNGQSKIKTTGTTKKPGSSLGLEFPEGTTKKPGSSLGLKFPNSNE